MRLNSSQLDAFFEVAQVGNFTHAAKNLHITQSALSQRISALEKEINTTLIIRGKSGVSLTELGEKFLRYCHKYRGLEEELLSEVSSTSKLDDSLSLRIAGFSSVMWSVVVPALRNLISENPRLHVNFQVHEVYELFEKLKSGAVDFIVTTEKPASQEMEVCLLGHEINVCVRPTDKTTRHEIFLDNDERDNTTFQFFKGSKRQDEIRRSFMDDIHGIIAGVSTGFGSAIIPRHLVKNAKGLRVESKKVLKVPVLLVFYKQPYYTALHEKVVKELKTHCAKILEG